LQVPSFPPPISSCASKPKRGPCLPLADFKIAFTSQSHCAVHVAGPSVDNFTTTLLQRAPPSPSPFRSHLKTCSVLLASVFALWSFNLTPSALHLALTSRFALFSLPGLRSSYLGSVLLSLSNSLVRLLPRLQPPQLAIVPDNDPHVPPRARHTRAKTEPPPPSPAARRSVGDLVQRYSAAA
jgi:hypothetical protein